MLCKSTSTEKDFNVPCILKTYIHTYIHIHHTHTTHMYTLPWVISVLHCVFRLSVFVCCPAFVANRAKKRGAVAHVADLITSSPARPATARSQLTTAAEPSTATAATSAVATSAVATTAPVDDDDVESSCPSGAAPEDKG